MNHELMGKVHKHISHIEKTRAYFHGGGLIERIGKDSTAFQPARFRRTRTDSGSVTLTAGRSQDIL
jgi:hypothetical protein